MFMVDKMNPVLAAERLYRRSSWASGARTFAHNVKTDHPAARRGTLLGVLKEKTR